MTARTHPPSAEGIVLVDFDGTIVSWGQLDNPQLLPGAAAALHELKRQGFKIGIFTSRLSPTWHRAEGRDPREGGLAQAEIIRRTLNAQGIPFDFITAEKVPAVLMLDDKAMRVSPARDLLAAVIDFLEDGPEVL